MAKMTMNFGGKDMEVDDLVARPPKGGKPPSFNDIKPLPNAKPTKPGDFKKYATPVKASGTNEGTDQASAEKNLRQDYENIRADEMQKKGRESFDRASPMKKGGKVKKYADGGMTTGQVQQPTYPFYGNQPQAGGMNGGMNQTFNMQPQANIDPNQQQQRFKKGGKVSSASSRADGCCVRGKTRA